MSHTRKTPPIKYSTANLPTDVDAGTMALDTTTNEQKVFNGTAWEVVEGEFIGTPTIVCDNIPAYDQIEGDIPDFWKQFYALKSVVIGTSCTSIGINAFRLNSGTEGSLVIPDSVITIKLQAFQYCGFSGTLAIGNSIASIQSSAFYDCNFTRIEIHATTAPTIGTDAFTNISPTDGKIHVPASATGYAASYDGLTVVYDL